MEILNIIFGILGAIGVTFGLITTVFRSKNKVVSNDLVHSMKIEELTTSNESFAKRLENLENWKSDISVNLAEIRKDLHFIADSIKSKSL